MNIYLIWISFSALSLVLSYQNSYAGVKLIACNPKYHFFSSMFSGMFEDSTYLYLIEPMDLTHTTVSLFLSNLFGLGECLRNSK